MNTRDKNLMTLARDGRYYASSKIVRQLTIDECLEELAKYAFTSHAYNVLRRLKEKQ